MSIKLSHRVSRVGLAVLLSFRIMTVLGQDGGKTQTRRNKTTRYSRSFSRLDGLSDGQISAIRKIFAGSANNRPGKSSRSPIIRCLQKMPGKAQANGCSV